MSILRLLIFVVFISQRDVTTRDLDTCNLISSRVRRCYPSLLCKPIYLPACKLPATNCSGDVYVGQRRITLFYTRGNIFREIKSGLQPAAKARGWEHTAVYIKIVFGRTSNENPSNSNRGERVGTLLTAHARARVIRVRASSRGFSEDLEYE